MLLQPYDWKCQDVYRTQFEIQAWCHNEQDEIHLLRILKWKPLLRIQLPYYSSGNLTPWSKERLDILGKWIRDRVEVSEDEVFMKPKEMQKMYYYVRNGKSLTVDIRAPTYDLINRISRCFYKDGTTISGTYYKDSDGNIYNRYEKDQIKGRSEQVEINDTLQIKVLETYIDPIHKFLVDTNLKYTGWIEVPDDLKPVPEKLKISLTKENAIDYRKIKSVSILKSTTPLIFAFDLEVYSSRAGAFPNPYLAKDEIFQCSCILQRFNRTETRKNILLTTKKTLPIKDVEVIHCENEIELLYKIADIIREYNPAIITGYNIFTFDIKYILVRCEHHNIKLPEVGCRKDRSSSIGFTDWKSSQYGQQANYYFDAHGRITVDMYNLIKRTEKLRSYKLEDVSQHFLGKGKHPVTPQDMFDAYEASTLDPDGNAEEMTRVASYCVEDSALCLDLMKKFNTWFSLLEDSSIFEVTIMSTFLRGQQIRVANQFYRFVSDQKIAMDRVEPKGIAKGGKVFDPDLGMKELVAVLDYASLYPSIIIAYNICYTTLVPDDVKMPEKDVWTLPWAGWNTKEDKDSKNADQLLVERTYRFVKKHVKEGILPQLCKHLIDERSAVRKTAKKEPDEIIRNILDSRQKSIKVSANSIYGGLNATGGKTILPEGAGCITAQARKLVIEASEYAKSKGFKMIYGDTDSIMISFGSKDIHYCVDEAIKLGEELTASYPPGLELEYENMFFRMLPVSKKFYVSLKSTEIQKVTHTKLRNDLESPLDDCYVWEVNGKLLALPKESSAEGRSNVWGVLLKDDCSIDKKMMMKKGVMSARRDNCLWAVKLYDNVIDAIIKKTPLQDISKMIDDNILKLLSRQVPLSDLVVSMSCSKEYEADSTYVMSTFLSRVRESGKDIEIGSRVSVVYVEDESSKVGDCMRLLEEYEEGHEKLDYSMYVDKLKKHLGTLLLMSDPSCEETKTTINQKMESNFMDWYTFECPSDIHAKYASIYTKKSYRENGKTISKSQIPSWVTSLYMEHWAKKIRAKKNVLQELLDSIVPIS